MSYVEKCLKVFDVAKRMFHVTVKFLQDYERVLDLMRDIILATDLAHHLKIMKDLEKMSEGLYTH